MGPEMPGGRGEIRIIGGAWRSRRVRFPAAPGLRPTPDRVRETLFNWLGSLVEGARVLDLFAGSGALGLEALSRGAARVEFVERRRSVAAALRANLERLGGDERGQVRCGDALAWLHSARGPFDLVFMDPPYASALAEPALALLAERDLLSPRHRIYVEAGADATWASRWEVLKRTRAGEVHAALLRDRKPAP